MGGLTRRSGQIVVGPQNPPKEMIPISARLLNMQLPQHFEKLPASLLRSSVRTAVICHRLGMPLAHVLAHRGKPCSNELRSPVAANHCWDIKYRPPMPDPCVRHSLGLQRHSVVVPLVLLRGLFAWDRHDVSAAKMTQSQTSPSMVTSGIAKTFIEINPMGLSRMALYTGLPAVDRLGCLVALQTAHA